MKEESDIMRQVRVIISTFSILVLSQLALGCATPPQTAIDTATAARSTAEAAGAEEYANTAYRAVVDAQAALDTELQIQADRMGILRSYDRTTELATALKTAAEQAEQAAIAGREQASADAVQMIGEARMVMSDAQAALATAPRGKGTARDLAALEADVQSAVVLVGEADEALQAGRFRDALTKAEAAKAAFASVAAAVEQARAARIR